MQSDWKALTFKPEEKELCLAQIASCEIVGLGVIALKGQCLSPTHSVIEMPSMWLGKCGSLRMEELNFILTTITFPKRYIHFLSWPMPRTVGKIEQPYLK